MTATRVIAATVCVWALALGAVWVIVTHRILETGTRSTRSGRMVDALRQAQADRPRALGDPPSGLTTSNTNARRNPHE
jgi:hypothetical protein